MLKEGIGKDISHTHFRNLSSGDYVGWWSPDPLENMFPGQSPYISMNNNPVSMIDARGDSAFVYGPNAQEYVDDLSNGSNVYKFSLDKNNMIQYEFKDSAPSINESDSDKDIIKAIKDTKHNVNIFANNNIALTDQYDYDTKEFEIVDVLIGTFGGSFQSMNETHESIQVVNMLQANLLYDNGILHKGDVSTHEFLESYYGIT